MEDKKTGMRGGARMGAGRKKIYVGGKKFAFNAGAEVATVIDQQPDKTSFINSCIMEHIDREGETVVDEKDKLATLLDEMAAEGEIYRMDKSEEQVLSFDSKVPCGLPADLGNASRGVMRSFIDLLLIKPEDCCFFPVGGYSMIGEEIFPDDVAIVDFTCRTPEKESPMLCRLNGDSTVKYVEIKDGHCRLVPANDEYPVIEVQPEDNFSIIGKVIYTIHRH